MRFSRTSLAALAAVCAGAVLAPPASAAQQWITGNSQYQQGAQCFGGSQTGRGNNTSSSVMYWGDTDGSFPKLGDKYYVQVMVGAIGFTCPWGASDVGTEIGLPEGTQLAVDLRSGDKNDRVRCWHISSKNVETEVTDFTWTHPDNASIKGKWCDSTKVPGAGQYASFNTGYRLLAQGATFVVRVPVVSTRPLKGMAGAGDTTKAWSAVTSGLNTMAVPFQWVTVGDRPVTVTSGASSKVGDTTATTAGVADVWWRRGKLSVELGTVASGGFAAVAGPFDIDGGSSQYTIAQDWGQLVPGTEYQWRVRFVDERGIATVGATKTFRTTGTAPSGPTTPTTPDPKPTTPTTPSTPETPSTPSTPETPSTPTEPATPTTPQPDVTPSGASAPATNAGAGTSAASAARTVSPSAPLAPAVSLAKDARLGKAFGVDVTCSAACTASATLKVDAAGAKKLGLGRKPVVVATGKGSATRAGKLRLTLRATKAAAAKLKAARSVRATLTVSVPGAPAATRTVTLKR